MTTNRLAWGTSEFLEQRMRSVSEEEPAEVRAMRATATELLDVYMNLQGRPDADEPMVLLQRRMTGQRLVRSLAWLLARNTDPRLRALAARYND